MSLSLLEQERMRREFVANAAHELRTPLTNLKGYLEALRDGVIATDRTTFESLWEETERLVRLSESLDRLEDGPSPAEPVDVDVRHAIDAAVALNRPADAARGLRWVIEAPSVLVARANPDHLAQVLANLLQNAVRYTPDGATITVRGEERPADVLVSVLNSGATIAADELPRLFERFYRVDRSRDRRSGGAGIGLAIVKQLVETAGGRVGAESGDGRTTVWFSLPRA
jgi:signal transduction histidine kinase